MAFIPAKRPVVAYPISVSIYDEDGKEQKIEFIAKYRRAGRKELLDLQDAMANHSRKMMGQPPVNREDGTTIPAWQYPTDLDFVQDRMVGWSGVHKADESELPFSVKELAAQAEAYPELVLPLFQGFFQAHGGAREKN